MLLANHFPPADVNAAIIHAFGLLVAHAIHAMALHAEKRGHSLKTGPGIAHSLKATVFWAGVQVNSQPLLLHAFHLGCS